MYLPRNRLRHIFTVVLLSQPNAPENLIMRDQSY